VVALVNGADRTCGEVVDAVQLARESLLAGGCAVAAFVVNRVAPAALDDVRASSRPRPRRAGLGLPEEPLLAMPTVAEVIDALDADLIAGVGLDLDREVTRLKIAAMSLPNVLDHIVEGSLLIVPGTVPTSSWGRW
jgi:phosphate acetyltransferase